MPHFRHWLAIVWLLTGVSLAQPQLPGPEHQKLDALEGRWNTVTTAYWGPEPVRTKGTTVYRWVLGGRFLMEEVKSQIPVPESESFIPMEGIGMVGFDRDRGVYVSMWADNQHTRLQLREGEAEGSSITFKGKGYQLVRHFDSDKHHRLEFFSSEGKLLFKIDYTRS